MKSIGSPFSPDLLLSAARSDDDIGVVIRAHFMIERCAVAKIAQILPNTDAVFGEKMDLVKAANLFRVLCVPQSVWASCRKFNQIRNGFAHGKIDRLSVKIIDELRGLLPEKARPFLESSTPIRVANNAGKDVGRLSGDQEIRARYLTAANMLCMTIMTLAGSFNAEVSFDDGNQAATWNALHL